MVLKRTIAVVLGALVITGCGPSIKTSKVAMPPSAKREPITLIITPGGGISTEDASNVKRLLGESFSHAGYGPVSFNGSRDAAPTVEVVVTKFEHLSPSDNTTMAAGVGCSYLCFAVAPCLLLPGYNEPQVEITAEVTAQQNGKVLFEKVLSERAKASSNAFDRGSEELHRELEELAAHNLTVSIVNLLDTLKPLNAYQGGFDTASSLTVPSPQPQTYDVDTLPTSKVKERKDAYAIVIGIEQYRHKLPKADYAAHDAQTVSNYLTRVLGYPEKNVVTLINDRALKSDFEKYFEKWLGNNVENGGSVFIYFSGHGAPNPKTGSAYIVPYDGDPAFIDQTGYPLKKIYESLGKLPAKEVVVALDSCFSGAGGRSVLAKGARPLIMNLRNDVVLAKNITVMSAASADQISSTYDEKGHGLFTYFMLRAIKDEDVTRQDGSLKIDNLFDYVKRKVEGIARKQYNNEQTPQLIKASTR